MNHTTINPNRLAQQPNQRARDHTKRHDQHKNATSTTPAEQPEPAAQANPTVFATISGASS